MNTGKIKVLFVCLGNICRSPTAEGVFSKKVDLLGLNDFISCDSAGTSQYHIGGEPDSRSIVYASKRGYDLSACRARQVNDDDFTEFDYILAMDTQNLANLKQIEPAQSKAIVKLMLNFAGNAKAPQDVPDPYYSHDQGFDYVLDLLEDACDGLLIQIKKTMA